jgi:hypothetical protein
MKHVQTFKSLARTILISVFLPKTARAKKRLLSISIMFFFALGATQSNAQTFKRSQDYVFDLQITAGITPFLGVLGGSFNNGSRSFSDIDISSLGSCLGAGMGIRVSKHWYLRAAYINATVKGNDIWSENEGRRIRNLSFKSPINEIYAVAEYTIASIKVGNIALEPRLFGGIGYFTFNPQALYNGKWVELQPLGTEGQGLKNNTSFYKKTSLSIPFGVALQARISDKNSIGFVLNFHKSFTDYIDDVSGTYYDNAELRSQRGDAAADLADRHLTNNDNPLASGSKRGNPNNNDNFGFISIVYSHSFGRTKSYHKASSAHLYKCFNNF